MTNSKFKVNSMVTLLRHDIHPQYVGKKVRIKKAYQMSNDDLQDMFVYRLEYNGETLKGVTPEMDLG